jgi:DNA-binding response OmpR family regulator
MAEDSDADVRLFKEAMRAASISVELERYSDGEACIRRLASNAGALPDLIVLDLNMPKLDGFEVLKAVRADARFQGVPVVMVTSSESEEEREASAHLGANGLIVKPLQLRDFIVNVGAAIRSLLSRTGFSEPRPLALPRDPAA